MRPGRTFTQGRPNRNSYMILQPQSIQNIRQLSNGRICIQKEGIDHSPAAGRFGIACDKYAPVCQAGAQKFLIRMANKQGIEAENSEPFCSLAHGQISHKLEGFGKNRQSLFFSSIAVSLLAVELGGEWSIFPFPLGYGHIVRKGQGKQIGFGRQNSLPNSTSNAWYSLNNPAFGGSWR